MVVRMSIVVISIHYNKGLARLMNGELLGTIPTSVLVLLLANF